MGEHVWKNQDNLPSKSFVCGYCGNSLASDKGYTRHDHSNTGRITGRIMICHFCSQPTYFDFDRDQTPGAMYGEKVDNLPDNINKIYDQARSCISINSYTASVLCCRKLLMHIAVSKGAKEGLSFLDYIEYLSNKGFVPPDGKEWVDHIRKKGNEANHEIVVMKKEDATDLIDFSEMLLKFIFEFPGRIKNNKNSETNGTNVA